MDTDSAQFPTEPRVVRARSSVYGIRPHMPLTDMDEARLRSSWKTVSMTTALINRPATEILFDLCLECTERRRDCTCYERGYN